MMISNRMRLLQKKKKKKKRKDTRHNLLVGDPPILQLMLLGLRCYLVFMLTYQVALCVQLSCVYLTILCFCSIEHSFFGSPDYLTDWWACCKGS